MAREVGRLYGEALDGPALGLQAVEAAARVETSEAISKLSDEVRILEAKLASLETSGGRFLERSNIVAARRLEEARRRDINPAEFSAVKGILYTALSILLLLADVSILGQVIARFLGYDWRLKDGRTFAQLVFTAPREAFHGFPDLFCLTLAILLMGFFVKVWRDARKSDSLTGTDTSVRSVDRTDYWIYTILLLLAITAVVAMTATRLTLDVGKAKGLLPRLVSTIVGLTLPFVSAGFFLKGYDVLSSRFALWRVSCADILYSIPAAFIEKKKSRLRAELESRNAIRIKMASPDHLNSLIARRKAEFVEGYRDGIYRLFSAGGSIVSRVRPLAIKLLLSRGE